MHSVPYTLAQAAQLGRAPSHLDFLFRQAMHAVLTHLRFWFAGSAPRRDFFLFAGGALLLAAAFRASIASGGLRLGWF